MIVEEEQDDYYDGESDEEDSDPNSWKKACALIYDGADFSRIQEQVESPWKHTWVVIEQYVVLLQTMT